jgi:hypothetical protein
MFRWSILILDGYPPTIKLVTYKTIILMWIINNSEYCELTDTEIIAISKLKWPNLKILRLGKCVLNYIKIK